jgi:PTS system N-acetylglucosamine-specific IIC component
VDALRAALGGAGNLERVELASTRLIIQVRDAAAVDESAVAAAGYRGVMRVAANTWHVIVGPQAARAAAALPGK